MLNGARKTIGQGVWASFCRLDCVQNSRAPSKSRPTRHSNVWCLHLRKLWVVFVIIGIWSCVCLRSFGFRAGVVECMGALLCPPRFFHIWCEKNEILSLFFCQQFLESLSTWAVKCCHRLSRFRLHFFDGRPFFLYEGFTVVSCPFGGCRHGNKFS